MRHLLGRRRRRTPIQRYMDGQISAERYLALTRAGAARAVRADLRRARRQRDAAPAS